MGNLVERAFLTTVVCHKLVIGMNCSHIQTKCQHLLCLTKISTGTKATLRFQHRTWETKSFPRPQVFHSIRSQRKILINGIVAWKTSSTMMS